MSSQDRFTHKAAPGRSIGFFDVRRLDRYAWHVTADGGLYEYDGGAFWHIAREDATGGRRPVADEDQLPFGPWCHRPDCDCEECLPGESLGPPV